VGHIILVFSSWPICGTSVVNDLYINTVATQLTKPGSLWIHHQHSDVVAGEISCDPPVCNHLRQQSYHGITGSIMLIHQSSN
jgi:hypothetical protein